MTLSVDNRLVEEARQLGRHGTDQEAVTAALHEYIERRRRHRIVELAGKVDYDEGYDHKKNRQGDLE